MSQPSGVGLSTPLLVQRLTHLSLLHSSLSLHQSSLLLSSILHSLLLTEPRESQGRILHAKALLDTGAPNSALHLVKQVALTTGDLRLAEVGARACDKLGRNREGLDLMVGAKQRWEEKSRQRGAVQEPEPLHPPTPTLSEQQSSTQCLLASLATKGNEPHKAVEHYLEALKLDPFNWEAFEGLCSIGHFPPSQDIFPPLLPSSSTSSNPSWPAASSSSTYANLPPANGFNGALNGRKHLQETKTQPAASGGGFFTPSDAGPAPSGMFARKGAAPTPMSSSPPAQAQHSFVLPPNHHPPPPTLTFSHLSGPSSSSTPISIEDGVGQPPAMKRPRGTGRAAIGVAAGRDPAFEGRNATGRNYSNGVEMNGKGRGPAPNSAASTSTPVGQGGSGDAPSGVRRSSRLSSVTTASVPRPSRFLPSRRPTKGPASTASSDDPSMESLDGAGRPRRNRSQAQPGGGGGPSFSDFGSPEAGNRSSNPPSPNPYATTNNSNVLASSSSSTSHPDAIKHQQELLVVDNWILSVLRIFGRAVMFMNRYDTKAAVEELDKLPREVTRGNARVCGMVGRCWFEMVDYVKAKRAFLQARTIDPYRLQDMDIFSTLLWHLHDTLSLAHLSQELISIDRLSPQAWIAVGNSFSLQKEHDEAMRCFRRASQLDPRCAYASTLSGHEAVSMEEFDRGIAFFETAVRIDRRHFNAWYGMGTAYLRKNKLRQAEHHFRRAVEINPSNAVLVCCVGQVLERRGKKEEALELFERAFAISPDSPMVAFRRAKALVSVGQIQPALAALQTLVLKAPNEFNIHFLLGKLYKLTNDPANAMKSFAHALDLDPKMNPAIKLAGQPAKTEEDDDEEDGEGEGGEGRGGAANESYRTDDSRL